MDDFTKRVDGAERTYRVVESDGVPVIVGYGAYLAGTDLSSLDLSGLDLSRCNLANASLTFTNLRGTKLDYANLAAASLMGADLRGASLHGVEVDDETGWTVADLRGATFDKTVVRGRFIHDDLDTAYLQRLVVEPTEGATLSDAPNLAVDKPVFPPEASWRGVSEDEALTRLRTGVLNLTSTDRWRGYLDAQAKVNNYSGRNLLLLLEQNPYITQVAGYNTWKDLGRQVRKGEAGLRVFAPLKYTTKPEEGHEDERTTVIRGFRLVSVFDVSQTDGEPLPEVATKLTGLAPEGVYESLKAYATEQLHFTVQEVNELDSGANGDCNHSTRLIRVVTSNDAAQQVKTLAHEMGHAILHDPDNEATRSLSRGHVELEAESCAYVVCQRLGLDSGEYSFGYVAGWAGGGDEASNTILASAGRIGDAAKTIVTGVQGEPETVTVSEASVVQIDSAKAVQGQLRQEAVTARLRRTKGAEPTAEEVTEAVAEAKAQNRADLAARGDAPAEQVVQVGIAR